MRFSVDRANLVRACSHMSGIVLARNVIPILNNVLLEAKGDVLTVTGNNLNMTISVSVPAKVAEEGSTTVEYHKLKSVADTASEGAELSCEALADASQMTVKAGRSRHRLLTLPAIDFPRFEMPDSAARFSLRGAEFERLLSVGYAAPSEDKAHPYLECVYLHRSVGGLAAVATDGHRLAFAEVSAPEGADDLRRVIPKQEDGHGVLVPSDAVKILRGLVSDDVAVIEVDESKIAVTWERGGLALRFASKLVDGTYPDYRRVIPGRDGKCFTIAAEPLAAATKRAMIALDGSSAGIHVTLSDGKLELRSRNNMGGEASDEVDCDWGAGAFETSVNARYLLATLAGLGSKEVEIRMADPFIAFRFDVPGDDRRVDVVMPMRV